MSTPSEPGSGERSTVRPPRREDPSTCPPVSRAVRYRSSPAGSDRSRTGTPWRPPTHRRRRGRRQTGSDTRPSTGGRGCLAIPAVGEHADDAGQAQHDGRYREHLVEGVRNIAILGRGDGVEHGVEGFRLVDFADFVGQASGSFAQGATVACGGIAPGGELLASPLRGCQAAAERIRPVRKIRQARGQRARPCPDGSSGTLQTSETVGQFAGSRVELVTGLRCAGIKPARPLSCCFGVGRLFASVPGVCRCPCPWRLWLDALPVSIGLEPRAATL